LFILSDTQEGADLASDIRVLVAPVAGQSPQANILRLDFYRVKPKHVTELETAGREYAALLRDGGAAHGFSVWRSESGDREYLRIEAYSNYTELGANAIGETEDRPRPLAAIDSHIENTRRLIVRVIPEASLPFDTGLPAMITITWMRSQLGKGGEFQTLAKSDLLPLMKKAGMKLFFVAQAVFGGPSSDYAIFTTLASWAMLDGPGPLMSMGEEAYQRYRKRRNALMVSREENVYRFCEDLSYLAGV
jgi:hypothetical protein